VVVREGDADGHAQPEIQPLAKIEASAETIEKARLIVEAALGLKAENPLVLNMTGVSSFADIFIILSGRSDRHVHSVTDAIVHALRESGEEPLGVEGQELGHWVLIDANDEVVHVFDPDTREHFALERLWSDAPTLDLVTDLGVETQPESADDGFSLD